MSKRYVSIFTVIIFVITMLPLSLTQKVYAYSNNSYFNDLKVGLVSMSAANITVTLGGEYTVNGQVYPSGSILNLGISGTSITFNGTSQNQINLNASSRGTLLTITSGTVSNKYMGSFIIKAYNGKVLPINTIDMENYLKGVVGYEMSDYFPIEALKAQAVSARNYALSRIGYEAAKGYDFDDTISYQVYKGYNASYTRVLSAVEQTKGQVLLYNDKLVETLYSAWHGGISENSENVWGNVVPYLRSVQDSYENDPWPNGNRVLTDAQVQSTLVTKGYITSTDTFIKLDLDSITNFASGRVSNINIVYKDGTGLVKTKSVVKDSTRTFLSLPSNLYTVTYDSVNGTYTFSGKGNGHGLGMSQIGAKNRATAGQTFEQILKLYYQNSYLQNLIVKASFNTFTESNNTLFVGDKISFSSTATGGNSYLYKYVIKNGSNVVLTKDYTTASTLDFTPSSSGSYTIEAYIRDAMSTTDYDDVRILTFTVVDASAKISSNQMNKTGYLVGQTMNLNTTANSGSGSYLYKYVVSKEGTVISTVDYNNVGSLNYKVDAAGTYSITTYVKDALSSKEYDDMQQLTATVYAPPTMSFVSSQDSGLVGTTFNYNINEIAGSGKAQYKFVVVKDNNVIKDTGYSDSNTFFFNPTEGGIFKVTGYLKDILSENSFDVQNTLNLSVYNPELSTVTATGSFYEGKILTFNASATGTSTLGFSYKYEIYNNNTLVTSNSFNTASSFNFTPSMSGNYTIKVYGKDGMSLNSYDIMKQFNATIDKKPLYLSVVPLKYGMTSNDVTSLQNALVKLGYTVSDTTGYFGNGTKAAVTSFQKSKGLTQDGIVGNMTYGALNDALIQKVGIKTVTY